ncbi:hypothetical protein R4B61_00870 [Fructilactobacillus vespulae]|uniref:DUF1659 domain-containing protein n=1 Tax=Fructilactobacillus vespulae TaxID=1249630 RepID=UPI0039B5AEDA
MKKSWIKSTASYTMIGDGHEKGVRQNYPNLVANVSEEKLIKFGEVLADLSGDTFQKVMLNDTNVIAE